jgi:hypothetical protein
VRCEFFYDVANYHLQNFSIARKHGIRKQILKPIRKSIKQTFKSIRKSNQTLAQETILTGKLQSQPQLYFKLYNAALRLATHPDTFKFQKPPKPIGQASRFAALKAVITRKKTAAAAAKQ